MSLMTKSKLLITPICDFFPKVNNNNNNNNILLSSEWNIIFKYKEKEEQTYAVRSQMDSVILFPIHQVLLSVCEFKK